MNQCTKDQGKFDQRIPLDAKAMVTKIICRIVRRIVIMGALNLAQHLSNGCSHLGGVYVAVRKRKKCLEIQKDKGDNVYHRQLNAVQLTFKVMKGVVTGFLFKAKKDD